VRETKEGNADTGIKAQAKGSRWGELGEKAYVFEEYKFEH
jgi:hypothetical protein